MNSLGLALFHNLCALGNALAHLRDTYEPCSDQWTALTCLVLSLDASIDLLVRSQGFVEDNDDAL